MSGLSASGARIRGDDLQHAYAAVRAVEVLLPGSTIIRVGIEDPDPAVHNADDVTIYRENGENEFVQVKSSVDAQTPATVEWLITPSASGGPSLLGHLYGAWRELKERGQNVRLWLVSNKQCDPRDPVLVLREGTDGTVASRLRVATPRSRAGRGRKKIADHLGVSEGELLEFLADVTLRFDQRQDDLCRQLSFELAAVGLRSDAQAVDLCISLVRGWVTSGRRLLTADEVRAEIGSLGIEASVPTATFVVQAIDHRPSKGATASVDWVDRYSGDEARSRRVPHDRNDWNDMFRPQLLEAVRKVRSKQLTRVHVGGAMRLPTWFAAGNAFGQTAGFDVEIFQNGELWTSFGPVSDCILNVESELIRNSGDEAAIVISIATDIFDEVRDYLATMPKVSSLLHIRHEQGSNPTVITDSRCARSMAVAVRNEARKLVRNKRPSRVHVFLACPGGFALLLGNIWDRIADTQLYADLAPGYAEAYLIPN